jgi:hypothetical protein
LHARDLVGDDCPSFSGVQELDWSSSTESGLWHFEPCRSPLTRVETRKSTGLRDDGFDLAHQARNSRSALAVVGTYLLVPRFAIHGRHTRPMNERSLGLK